MPPQAPATTVAPVAPLTIGKFKASKMITLQALALLKQDTEILWFPVLSTVVSIIALTIFGVVLFFVSFGGSFTAIDSVSKGGGGASFYLTLFVLYLVMYFIANFFVAGIYTIVDGRLHGQNLTFSDGINGARQNAAKIFWWSAISATVGVVLRMIEDRSSLVGKLIAGLFGVAWAVLTYFSLPAIVIGKLSVKDSFKQSAAVIRKMWGETIIINLGVGIFMTGLMFFALIVTVLVIILAPSTIVIVGMGSLFLICLVLLIVLSTTLGAIFKVALYEYAVTGQIPNGFSPELIENAVRSK
ncbi:MAG: hypothetical protein RLZZ26_527 [Candidatus Parcubacteria bacterium]|jgi:hypothetical protein